MILDRLENLSRYALLHEGIAAAAAFIERIDLRALPPGRCEIDGERLYANVDHVEGKGREGATLEVHRRYIDIQIAIQGTDVIGWKPAGECTESLGEFDAEKDAQLFADEPAAWIDLSPGTFAVFFTDDAHAPLAAEGPLHKVVVKVAVD